MRYVLCVYIMQSAPVSDDDHVCECVYCVMDITALLHTSACMVVKICSAHREQTPRSRYVHVCCVLHGQYDRRG